MQVFVLDRLSVQAKRGMSAGSALSKVRWVRVRSRKEVCPFNADVFELEMERKKSRVYLQCKAP